MTKAMNWRGVPSSGTVGPKVKVKKLPGSVFI